MAKCKLEYGSSQQLEEILCNLRQAAGVIEDVYDDMGDEVEAIEHAAEALNERLHAAAEQTMARAGQ